MKLIFALAVILPIAAICYGQNEQSPIVEKDIAYKDWTLKSARDGQDTKLRELIKNEKLVAVVYFGRGARIGGMMLPYLKSCTRNIRVTVSRSSR